MIQKRKLRRFIIVKIHEKHNKVKFKQNNGCAIDCMNSAIDSTQV